ncbi:hypothetical protein D3C86_2146330 [compost metagenome]
MVLMATLFLLAKFTKPVDGFGYIEKLFEKKSSVLKALSIDKASTPMIFEFAPSGPPFVTKYLNANLHGTTPVKPDTV